MIELLGITLTYEAAAWLAAFAVSEAIALSPLKENSVAQVLKTVIDSFRGVRTEDDQVRKARRALLAARKAAQKAAREQKKG